MWLRFASSITTLVFLTSDGTAQVDTKPVVTVEAIDSDAYLKLPETFRSMVEDFHRAGGRGRTFLVHSEIKGAAGAYLAVDELPVAVLANGDSIFTREPKVLQELKKAKLDGIPIFLQSVDQNIDAQVFANDGLGRPLREAAFPRSDKAFSLSVSPSMSSDIFIHEMAHIEHQSPRHEINAFLESIRRDVDETQLRNIRRALSELLAYKAQLKALERMKNEGTAKVFEFVGASPNRHIERTQFREVLKKRNQEIAASMGLYMQTIASHLRKMPETAQCKTIDQTRKAIAGLGSMETNLLETFIEFARCRADPPHPASTKTRH